MNMFLGLMLVCDPNQIEACAIVRGPFFDTYEECIVDLSVSGLSHILNQYGPDVHLAYIDCVEVELQGEPA